MKLDTAPRFPADSKLMERKLTDLFRDIAYQVNLTPPGSTGNVTYNNDGVPGASSNFTYNAGTNTVTFGNLTGSALDMTIQPRAPTVLENPGTLRLQGRDAVKANTRGGAILLQGGNKTGTGSSGEVVLKSQDGETLMSVSNEGGIFLKDSFGTTLSMGNGFISVVGPQSPPAVDAPMQFVAGLNSTSTGNNPFQFLTDSGIIFEFGESTFGTQEIAFFGATPVAQSTGWGTPTGTANKATFATSSVTTAQLAERVKAIIDYLKLRGDFGA